MGIRAPSAGEQQGTLEVSGETLLGPRLWRGKGGGVRTTRHSLEYIISGHVVKYSLPFWSRRCYNEADWIGIKPKWNKGGIFSCLLGLSPPGGWEQVAKIGAFLCSRSQFNSLTTND